MSQIKVVVVRPKQAPVVELVGSTLEAQQKLVGGYIEMACTDLEGQGIYMICNEDALSLGLPYNREVDEHQIFGTCFFHGLDDEGEPLSLTDAQIQSTLDYLKTS